MKYIWRHKHRGNVILFTASVIIALIVRNYALEYEKTEQTNCTCDCPNHITNDR